MLFRGQKAGRDLVGMAQRRQMTTGDHLDLEAESLPGDPALELQREQPVLAAGQHPRRHVGPVGQRPRPREWGLGLLRLRMFLGLGSHLGGDVVEEVLDEVEFLPLQPDLASCNTNSSGGTLATL